MIAKKVEPDNYESVRNVINEIIKSDLVPGCQTDKVY